MTIYSAVLIQYQRVTDRQTDVQPISITCFSIADARKKPIGFAIHFNALHSVNALYIFSSRPIFTFKFLH